MVLINELQKNLFVKKQDAKKENLSLLIQSILKNSGTQNSINVEYLINIVKESKLSFDEINKILGAGDNKKAIYRLWMCALLLRIKNKHQMSIRYNDFLEKISDLLIKNRINIEILKKEDILKLVGKEKTTYAASYSSINTSARPNTISFIQPSKDKASIREFETGLVHELYHAYQDFIKKKITLDRCEAESYLAQADLIMHQNPKNIGTSWIIFEQYDGRYEFYVSPPKKYAEKISGLSEKDPVYLKMLDRVERDYGGIRIFFSGLLSREVAGLAISYREYLANKQAQDGEPVNLRQIFMKAYQRLKNSKNEKIDILNGKIIASNDFKRDLVYLKVCMNFAAEQYKISKDIGWIDDAEKYIKDYFELFLSKTDLSAVKLDNPYTLNDGIK